MRRALRSPATEVAPLRRRLRRRAYRRLRALLALPDDEQTAVIQALDDEAAELYITLLTARALYVDPIDRGSGITEAKVAKYPDRYRWPDETL